MNRMTILRWLSEFTIICVDYACVYVEQFQCTPFKNVGRHQQKPNSSHLCRVKNIKTHFLSTKMYIRLITRGSITSRSFAGTKMWTFSLQTTPKMSWKRNYLHFQFKDSSRLVLKYDFAPFTMNTVRQTIKWACLPTKSATNMLRPSLKGIYLPIYSYSPQMFLIRVPNLLRHIFLPTLMALQSRKSL